MGSWTELAKLEARSAEVRSRSEERGGGEQRGAGHPVVGVPTAAGKEVRKSLSGELRRGSQGAG